MADVLRQAVAQGIVQRTLRDGDQLVNEWTQPGRELILEANRSAVNDRSARTMGWGEPVLRIPTVDYEMLKQSHPQLFQGDAQQKRAAWVQFLNSAESVPFRVRPKRGGATGRVVVPGRGGA
jgi:hypothetical protein